MKNRAQRIHDRNKINRKKNREFDEFRQKGRRYTRKKFNHSDIDNEHVEFKFMKIDDLF